MARLLLLSAGVTFVLLVVGGIVHSLGVEGRLPNVRFGYAEQHRRLIETQGYAADLSDLRTAAAVDFDNAAAQLELLTAAQEAGDAEGVALALRGLLRQTPDDPDLHHDLAGALLAPGDLDQALRHSRRAVELDPASARFHCMHGAVLLALGRHREAAAAYRRALETDPDMLPAIHALEHPLKDY
jgi:Flp pilus assembly protein TadD